jgi:two-component system alkaline phosphatase synthesis response regulator PhoP
MIMARILLIDDEEDFGFFVKSTLELNGRHKVFLATDGKAGIKTALRQSPDLILLDIMMPGMSGFQVLKNLKENKKIEPIPVVMLTARNDDESIEEAVGLYCENYIIKPVEMLALQSKIEDVLSSYRIPSARF